MPKYAIARDTRDDAAAPYRDRLSMVIEAHNREEAQADFEARWQQKASVRTTAQIQAEAMTPEALRVKRNTRGMKG